jgi:hypothetical protein
MLYQPSATALSWASGEKLRQVWRACGKGASEPIGPPALATADNGRVSALDGKPLIYLFMFVPDSEAAHAFYQGTLGLHTIERVHCCNPACPPEEKGVAKYDAGGMLITTHHIHESPVVDDFGRIYSLRVADPEGAKGIAPVFLISNIRNAVELLAQRQINATGGVIKLEIGDIARFEAPTGHTFYLYEPRSEVLQWPTGAKIRQILAM